MKERKIETCMHSTVCGRDHDIYRCSLVKDGSYCCASCAKYVYDPMVAEKKRQELFIYFVLITALVMCIIYAMYT